MVDTDAKGREGVAHSIEPLMYSVDDAAAALGIGTTLLRVLIRRGDVRATRLGKRLLVPRRELVRLTRQGYAEDDDLL